MSEYLVCIDGCDDSTYALVELTDAEAEAVARAFAATNARSFVNCQPKALLMPKDDAPSYDLERATEKHWAEED
jgi:hypothetical protein